MHSTNVKLGSLELHSAIELLWRHLPRSGRSRVANRKSITELAKVASALWNRTCWFRPAAIHSTHLQQSLQVNATKSIDLVEIRFRGYNTHHFDNCLEFVMSNNHGGEFKRTDSQQVIRWALSISGSAKGLLLNINLMFSFSCSQHGPFRWLRCLNRRRTSC